MPATTPSEPARRNIRFLILLPTMGAQSSTTAGPSSSGVVTVSRGRKPAAAETVDADLAALKALPPFAPLLKPPTLRSLFSSKPTNPDLPALHGREVSALCREYASLSRHAALPLCEEQRAIAKKMAGVEALCARVLYLMALRSGELTTSATALRELSAVGESIDESRANLQRLIARADALERRLPAMSGGAL